MPIRTMIYTSLLLSPSRPGATDDDGNFHSRDLDRPPTMSGLPRRNLNSGIACPDGKELNGLRA